MTNDVDQIRKNTCPAPSDLKHFSIGRLSQDQIHFIAEHLRYCRKCETQIRQFDNHKDEIVLSLAGIPESSQVEEVHSTLGMPPDDSKVTTADSEPIVLDPGKIFSARLANGQVSLGNFQLESELGAGSFGYVFLARDTRLDRQVAIKIQRAPECSRPEEIQRFQAEAKNAAQLKHPAIVSIFETCQTEDGVCYLVNEYVEGETLKTKMLSETLTFQQSTHYLIQLAEALEYAHQNNVVHRDVKPSNIIVDPQDNVHLADFGLAKNMTADANMTHEGQVMGTPAYMSPEQAFGRSDKVDNRSDIYSMGVVMYELLTGQQPFQGKNRLLFLQVLEDDPRPPTQLRDTIPRDLEVICLKAMAKLPRLRYQSAQAFAEDVKRHLNNEPILARPTSYVERLIRWCRRYPAAVIAFAVLFAGAIAAMFYLFHVSQYLVRETARDSAEMQANMLDSINEYYAGLVKQMDIHLHENGIAISEADLESIRPVPARFTIELGNQLESVKTVGWQIRLYSNYPFPNRSNGGPPDEFGKRAIAMLEKKPDEPVVEFTKLGGIPVVRFATARLMTDSCVDCHNNHRNTPKNDWKTGDVRGVLEVIRPLAKDEMRTRQGMGNAISWILTLTFMLTVFVSVIAFATTRKQ